VSRDYELGVIFNPEVSEEETRSVLDRIDQIVATHGGQVVRVNQWGRRRLAYPIERHRDGFYVFIDMILTPETVSDLERMLKVSEIVLRYMTRTRDAKAVQKEREDREARAAAAPAATEEGAAQGEATPASTDETPEEVPAATSEVPALSPEEIDDVPPAIEPEPEEETIEA
jgi:small subunit ribosomal protein S6